MFWKTKKFADYTPHDSMDEFAASVFIERKHNGKNILLLTQRLLFDVKSDLRRDVIRDAISRMKNTDESQHRDIADDMLFELSKISKGFA